MSICFNTRAEFNIFINSIPKFNTALIMSIPSGMDEVKLDTSQLTEDDTADKAERYYLYGQDSKY